MTTLFKRLRSLMYSGSVASVLILARIAHAGYYKDSSYWGDETGLPDQQFTEILLNIFQWLLGMVGIFAVAAFLVSGVTFLAASTNPKLKDRAKTGTMAAFIGVLVSLMGLTVIYTIEQLLDAGEF